MVLTLPDTSPPVAERIHRSASVSAKAGFHQLSFQAMNTLCRVHFSCANAGAAKDYQAQVLAWVAWFESRYSRFLPESLVSRINAAAGEHWVEVDPETDAILNLCQEMIFFTSGTFDPTSLPLIRLWNWKATPPVIPNDSAIAEARELCGWRRIQRRKGAIFLPRKGMCLDLGGVGKEYAVDRVMTFALDRGINNVLVDFGQDVRVNGEPPERGAWHIGLQDPTSPDRCWTGVAAKQNAVATSGDYLRYFTIDGRRYGHILDPRSGQPVDNGTVSVSVIAPNCTLAGILSTSVFILGLKAGMDLLSACPGVEGAITTRNSRHLTRGFYQYATS